ncbi:MAG: N,N-dimethylformamidase beta subunit family domain-containing protein [Gammaproteobacteria bacterium]
MLPLTGYADRFSAAPGDTIAFKISSTAAAPFDAHLVRVIHGDPNPAGPGIKEQDLSGTFSGSYPSRMQSVHLGSYAHVEHPPAAKGLTAITLVATVWPTTPQKGQQGIISMLDLASGSGIALVIDDRGCACALAGDVEARTTLSSGKPLRARAWYRVWASFDPDSGALRVGQAPLRSSFGADDTATVEKKIDFAPALNAANDIHIAAMGGAPVTGHYNGKLERPAIVSKALDKGAIIAAARGEHTSGVIAAWDFSEGMSSQRIADAGPHGLHGELVNVPARAVTGSDWHGEEMCWRHAPHLYGAIHFHDDDIYDCKWDTDFTFTVPDDLRSGYYAMRLRCGDAEDMIPIFVRPKRGHKQADICLLASTFTYTVYGNHARNNTDDDYRRRVNAWNARPWTPDEHRDYGFSTYNVHSDGSGIAYASRLRPMITMRSGYVTFAEPFTGSGLRHYPADTHLIDWLETKGYAFDVITDEDLHDEGVALITPYKTVLTPSHPEYHTSATLDALQAYVDGGGRLMYLGGNGFYWRVAVHPDLPGMVEIRRAEGGIRAWAAEPGEYYNAFDGQYGGLWRRNGRPPQQLAGVGFSGQGKFEGTYYRRAPGAADPRAAWIFAGVDDEILGDFGLSGNGAAGFELDRVDRMLGSPDNIIVLASSDRYAEHFVLVPEEQLTHLLTWPGEPKEKLIRADMAYFETPDNGAVFSVGSITYCGSLSHNNYDNNISRITDNVLKRFSA